MNIPLLIERTREGEPIGAEEVEGLISAFTAGAVPDYQMSAWAMAVYFRGLSEEATSALTRAMRDSGRVFRWPEGSPRKVDKHSTGGTGDKVSLVLAPLLACDGLWVPMVSGRGLGITGGTLDKLESIPGFDVHLDEARCLRQIEKLGVFMAGQTEDFCPADKRLYALRDVTGTVPSRPLIIASIMSKKLAESLDRLVLDVKFGSGAFMKSRADAERLAEELTRAGLDNGVKTTFLLTPMDEPLGRTVGNALEVREAVETLQGEGPEDLVELTLSLAAAVSESPKEKLREFLQNGTAWEKFLALVEAQGGDVRAFDRWEAFHSARVIRPLLSPRDGVLQMLDAGRMGAAAVKLGAGRQTTSDAVDFSVGFSGIRKIGTPIVRGEPILWIHAATDSAAEAAERDLIWEVG